MKCVRSIRPARRGLFTIITFCLAASLGVFAQTGGRGTFVCMTKVQAERALGRIANRTYGICENCGNPIGKARLQVFPRATLCMTCKQREERR